MDGRDEDINNFEKGGRKKRMYIEIDVKRYSFILGC